MPEISVIVPVYNVSNYLEQCIQSITVQSFHDFELILVDDGSVDNSGVLCDKWSSKDSRIRTIHQKNGGVSMARNTGINAATGRCLAFVDSDDRVTPNYLHDLYYALIQHQADISVCGDFKYYDDTVSDTRKYDKKDNFKGIRICTKQEACEMIYTGPAGRANYVTPWGKLFRRELFDGISFPEGKIHEDQFTMYRIFYRAQTIVEIGACLYGYFINMQGITHANFSIRRYDDVEACMEAITFFSQNGEKGLALAAEQRKDTLIAKYSVMARKAGIYREVPSAFKLSLFAAQRMLTKIHGEDFCDYFLHQYYPQYIRTCSYLRKLKEWMKKRCCLRKN